MKMNWKEALKTGWEESKKQPWIDGPEKWALYVVAIFLLIFVLPALIWSCDCMIMWRVYSSLIFLRLLY